MRPLPCSARAAVDDSWPPPRWPGGGGLYTSQLRNGTSVIVAHSLTDGTSKVVTRDESLWCDLPLALSESRVLFVCEDLVPQGQAGESHPGTWERTVFRLDTNHGEAVPLFRIPGAVRLLAASPSGRQALYHQILKPPEAVVRIFDTTTGEARDLVHEPGGEAFVRRDLRKRRFLPRPGVAGLHRS